ncbi:MAG: acyltransferase [Azonexus sp.]|nr:acyltransferase [Betaproteobacteria bacterium]MBK8918967.1 acyltransferase [Betaproteobacteria bacterium]MBP6035781.1 acyltransferase [Azonexus sp.]MBP6905418.1 acyltransferase [Azonexus sp.]
MAHRNIKGFDGIRALAVIAVILSHVGVYAALTERGLLSEPILAMVGGGTGVQAFFVLSGFLITSLLIAEFDATGSISIRKFILRRTLRIFPLYILFLLIVTVLHLLLPGVTTWPSLYYAYAYAFNFAPTQHYTPILGHTWSLAVEEHFYLVWPSLFLLTYARRRPYLVGLTLVFIFTAPLLNLAFTRLGIGREYFVGRFSFIAGAAIALGCLMALLAHGPRTADRFRRTVASPWTLAAGLLLFANSLYLQVDSWFLKHAGSGLARNLGIALLVGWIYFNQTSRLTRFLELRPLKYIGLISYGLYLFQGLFLTTDPTRTPQQAWPPSPEVGLLLLLLAAPLAYHFFEIPFLRLKSRYAAATLPAGGDPSPTPAPAQGR